MAALLAQTHLKHHNLDMSLQVRFYLRISQPFSLLFVVLCQEDFLGGPPFSNDMDLNGSLSKVEY